MPNRRLFLAAAFGAISSPLFAQSRKTTGDTDVMALKAPPRIAGRYTSLGINADGSKYEGVALITQNDNDMTITWVVNGQESSGNGTIDGRVVTVIWGDTFPAFYIIMDDGSLHGTYSDGLALEKLTPR